MRVCSVLYFGSGAKLGVTFIAPQGVAQLSAAQDEQGSGPARGVAPLDRQASQEITRLARSWALGPWGLGAPLDRAMRRPNSTTKFALGRHVCQAIAVTPCELSTPRTGNHLGAAPSRMGRGQGEAAGPGRGVEAGPQCCASRLS
eukprot:5378218-Pyramimonas_sp.AAC.4